MMGWSPGLYIPSFVDFGPPVPEKKTFERFLPYMGYIWVWWPSLSCDEHHVIRFSFLVPESFQTKFGSDRHSSF